jgi:tetratricopeptide (TPR) repeat protein
MKTIPYIKLLLIPVLLFLVIPNVLYSSDSNVTLFEKANQLYAEKKYKEAFELYQSLVEKEKPSFEIYYNAGLSAFKAGDIAMSVFYLEKARKINPVDKELLDNLNMVYANIPDKIEYIIDPSLTDKIIYFVSGDTWSWMALLFLILSTIFINVFYFSMVESIKKISFWSAIFMLILFSICLIPSYWQYNRWKQQHEAVVVVPSVQVKEDPSNNSKRLFNLHEGTKIKIKKETDRWLLLELPNNLKGWINKDAVKKI